MNLNVILPGLVVCAFAVSMMRRYHFACASGPLMKLMALVFAIVLCVLSYQFRHYGYKKYAAVMTAASVLLIGTATATLYLLHW